MVATDGRAVCDISIGLSPRCRRATGAGQGGSPYTAKSLRTSSEGGCRGRAASKPESTACACTAAGRVRSSSGRPGVHSQQNLPLAHRAPFAEENGGLAVEARLDRDRRFRFRSSQRLDEDREVMPFGDRHREGRRRRLGGGLWDAPPFASRRMLPRLRSRPRRRSTVAI
jgi:hypothetical protein